jgi:DNA-binding NarL/FixJ family response regulator
MSAQGIDSRIRLLLVDDHEVVRAGLRALLSQVETIDIVGDAGTVAEAVTAADRLRPQVVLMDLRLPDGTGVEACRDILSLAPQTRILFLTSHSDDEAVMSTILAGAAGYLLKDIGHLGLVRAIHEAADGRRILDSKLAEPVLEQVRTSIREGKSPQGRTDALSAQESRILGLVVEGRTNKEIAAAMDLSDKTVKNYLSNAFQKLQVNRRAQAAALFARQRTKPAADR